MDLTYRLDTEPLDFPDRFALLQSALVVRYEERDNFLSDDDVLDAAVLFTTSDMDAWFTAWDLDPSDRYDDLRADYDLLVGQAFAWLTPSEEN